MSQPDHHSHDHADHAPVVTDSGARALEEALRSSFVIVRIAMVVLLGVVLLSGVKTIGPAERGIKFRERADSMLTTDERMRLDVTWLVACGLYVIDTIHSPADSKEKPTLYIRGCEGLEERVAAISAEAAGELEYIGEWHSHPDLVRALQHVRQIFA